MEGAYSNSRLGRRSTQRTEKKAVAASQSRPFKTKLAPLRHNEAVTVDPPMVPASERVLRCVAQAWAVLLLASGASAQESAWPSRTIQMVVPYTPGTGADILARILGPKLGDRWKIGVVTDNRAGASGNIGTDFVAKATPDGYTLLCTATSSARIPRSIKNSLSTL